MISQHSGSSDSGHPSSKRPSSIGIFQVIWKIGLVFCLSAAISGIAAVAAYQGLMERDRRLAKQEVQEYVDGSPTRIAALLELPSIHELTIRPAESGDPRVLFRAQVDDRAAEQLIRDEFDDVKHERFEPVWEVERLSSTPQPREIVLPSLGAVRAYSVRSTLAAGVAGILFTVIFSLLAIITFRRIFR